MSDIYNLLCRCPKCSQKFWEIVNDDEFWKDLGFDNISIYKENK